MRKTVLLMAMISIMILLANFSFAQSQNTEKPQEKTYSYAYLSVRGHLLNTKKLIVEVDLGDTQEQINVGKEYSAYLTDKTSYAAILNYMVSKQFELVQALEQTSSYQGSGGTYCIIFIMKKRIDNTQ
jgi:hypothetical protein